MIDEGGYDDEFTWNHECECECESNKSCDFGEYLDYENCKCGKKLIGKLVLECKNEILNAIPLNETDAVSVTDKNVICKLNICKLNKRHNCLIYIILWIILLAVVSTSCYYNHCTRYCLRKEISMPYKYTNESYEKN